MKLWTSQKHANSFMILGQQTPWSTGVGHFGAGQLGRRAVSEPDISAPFPNFFFFLRQTVPTAKGTVFFTIPSKILEPFTILCKNAFMKWYVFKNIYRTKLKLFTIPDKYFVDHRHSNNISSGYMCNKQLTYKHKYDVYSNNISNVVLHIIFYMLFKNTCCNSILLILLWK